MVDILESQKKMALFCDRKTVGNERGEGMAEVEISGWAGCESGNDHDRGRKSISEAGGRSLVIKRSCKRRL